MAAPITSVLPAEIHQGTVFTVGLGLNPKLHSKAARRSRDKLHNSSHKYRVCSSKEHMWQTLETELQEFVISYDSFAT